ncbi:hypothetical protein ACFQ1E_20770 [Sphingomonas canadensis]|uniref:Uncharacterized protein n=1 Tax=Sphingomonas canadensis TaxID=1219257 RepID=A0ABW3HCB6_9SPHN|nr:hypothetical protein [Sphingomonas canadensis]MCW3838476.1 hypothetical protein [Sphingomonas canadensis]
MVEIGNFYTDEVTGSYIVVGGSTPADARAKAEALMRDLPRLNITSILRNSSAQTMAGSYQKLETMQGTGISFSFGGFTKVAPVFTRSWGLNLETGERPYSGDSAGIGVTVGGPSGQFTYTIFFDTQKKKP